MTIDRHNIENKLNQSIRQYIGTALWSSTVSLPVDESELVDGEMPDLTDDHPLHGIAECEPYDSHFDIYDFPESEIDKAQADIDRFLELIEHLDTSDYDDSDLMHDFWLTRNGHGAGFWDGDYPDELGEALTKVCKEFSEVNIWVDESGTLYFD